MSPRIRLMCYPTSDLLFAQHVALHLTVDYPDSTAVDEMVGEVQARLRDRHPSATVLVGEALDEEVVWHVYRDGQS